MAIGQSEELAGHLVHDPELCAGCRTCMSICSLSHRGVSSPELSGVQVMMMPREGALVEANACRQCKGAECLYACPVEAIYVDEATGAKIIHPEKCIGCKLCQEACSHNAINSRYSGDGLAPIRYDAENNICFKCDLCGGNPLCVKFCSKGALSLSREGV